MAIDNDLDQRIATAFFGWRWVVSTGLPTKGHPEYFNPEMRKTKMRVRTFCKQEHGETATGDEPLSYCYCSSSGYPIWPMPTSGGKDLADLEAEILKRGLQPKFEKWLAGCERSPEEKLHPWRPSPRMICEAALAAAERLRDPNRMYELDDAGDRTDRGHELMMRDEHILAHAYLAETDPSEITPAKLLALGFKAVPSDMGPTYNDHYQIGKLNIWHTGHGGKWCLSGEDWFDMEGMGDILTLLRLLKGGG